MENFQPGDMLDNRYWLQEVIGAGAHGTVFRAQDLQAKAEVAIKCLHPELAQKPALQARLEREARAMCALSGTSAAQILAASRTRGGTLYLVMELLQGKDLEATLRELEAEGRALPVPRMVELLAPIVATLEAAHARGIIHRDLKPANIFVLDDAASGPVRLLDFGLVKDLNAAPLTAKGTIAGSPAYVAPEVWRGKPEALDHRIDVYSMGAVVFRALAGRAPFQGETRMDLVVACVSGPRPSLHARRPELPEGVDGWVARALAIAPEDRFQDIRALWGALLDELGGLCAFEKTP